MLNRLLARLDVSRKFLLVLSVQALLLVGVAALGWVSLMRLQGATTGLADNVAKSKLIGRALNDSNVLRTVHISMIAAAHNGPYLAKRSPRMQEYEGRVRAILAELPAQPWTAAERPLAAEGAALMKKYMEGFATVLATARDRKEDAVPELMEANVQVQREARERLEKLQEEVLKASGAEVQASAALGRHSRGWILGIALGGLAAAMAFVRLVAHQMTHGVRDLERAMDALHSGDLTVQSRVEGRDELSHISANLNQAMERLRDNLGAMALIAERNASSATELSATSSQINAAIEANVRRSAEQVHAIALALEDQARTGDGVVQGMSATMKVTERNASATTQLASSVEETARTVADLAQLAGDLRQRIYRFKLA